MINITETQSFLNSIEDFGFQFFCIIVEGYRKDTFAC